MEYDRLPHSLGTARLGAHRVVSAIGRAESDGAARVICRESRTLRLFAKSCRNLNRKPTVRIEGQTLAGGFIGGKMTETTVRRCHAIVTVPEISEL